MADVRPIHATHYDLDVVGSLQDVAAPPYDVIDAGMREELLERSPYNAVAIDLPKPYGETGPQQTEDDPYERAARLMEEWREAGALVADAEPAIWAMTQDYTGPDGTPRTRHGILARVRVEDFSAGQVLPHERTLPGPKKDRLDLTHATKHNLSPIFSLSTKDAWPLVAPAVESEQPWGEATDEGGTVTKVWRVGDPAVHAQVTELLGGAQLLIADGHHRYETARVYMQEGGADHVLMCLVALQDPGLTVFPTHRLITALAEDQRARLREILLRDFEAREVGADELEPTGDGPVRIGYLDGPHGRPTMLTLRDPEIVAAKLPDKPLPYRRLDTAVLETLILQGALGMTEYDISHLNGLDYARSTAQARAQVESGAAEAAFFMRGTPVSQVRDVAAAGESMPPKSTYFFPKVLTGMLFNPLD